MKRRLVIFAKYPLPGHVKSRLAADLGLAAAAGVYARLLYTYLLRLVEAPLPGIEVLISVAAPEDAPFFTAAFPEFAVRVQQAGDLGHRLASTCEEAFAAGADAVVVSASDSPHVGPPLVRAAFDALEEAPAVIGPCRDGGYYLIGLRAPGAPLFDGIAWSTERVLAQTEALARARGLRMVRLSERLDVDTVEDLARWRSQR